MDKQIIQRLHSIQTAITSTSKYDITDPDTYHEHAVLIEDIGNIILSKEGKSFIIDQNNEMILRFLLYYFNGSSECEKIPVCKDPSVNKNIIINGGTGTGKSIIMQIFSMYCKITENNLAFYNIDITELLNYYKTYNSINLYTFNIQSGTNYENTPFSYCLNDIGVDLINQKSYGTNVKLIIDEWLQSRYAIWQKYNRRYFITTNLTMKDIEKEFDFRLNNRFKAFNIIPMIGESRR